MSCMFCSFKDNIYIWKHFVVIISLHSVDFVFGQTIVAIINITPIFLKTVFLIAYI